LAKHAKRHLKEMRKSTAAREPQIAPAASVQPTFRFYIPQQQQQQQDNITTNYGPFGTMVASPLAMCI